MCRGQAASGPGLGHEGLAQLIFWVGCPRALARISLSAWGPLVAAEERAWCSPKVILGFWPILRPIALGMGHGPGFSCFSGSTPHPEICQFHI